MNILDEMQGYMVQRYGSHPDWCGSVASNLLSTVVGRDIRVITRIGPLNLNRFSMIIGPSGISGKTNPLKYFTVPILSQIADKIKSQLILPSRYSVEGIVEYMNENTNEGIIVRDEFTSVFKNVANGGYQADTMEFMSEMYDGSLQKRYTKSCKLEELKNVYVNLLCATTPYLFTVMDRGFFMQGTGNRIDFTLDDPDRNSNSCEDDFLLNPYQNYESDIDYRNKLVDRLINLRQKLPRGNIGFELDAAKILMDYYNEKRENSLNLYKKNWQDLEYSYLVRCPEFAFKYAGIRCISSYEEDINDFAVTTMLVNKEDAQWAIDKVERHLVHFRRIMNAWATVSIRQPVKTAQSDFEFIKSIITEYGGSITQKELISRTQYNFNKFKDIMNALVSSGELIYKKDEEYKGKGPKPITYSIKPQGVL